MPMDRAEYPPDWPAISRRVREVAGWKCQRCGKPQGSTATKSGKPVVLTVHHPDGDKANPDARLECLCQAHHLEADRELHMRNAAETRRKKRINAGQLPMEMVQ